MNREKWLDNALERLKSDFFVPENLEFATPLKVSTGWCYGNKKAIGQCFSSVCSEGNLTEMFISPKLSDPIEVLATLLHEMIHAHLGTGKGHGREFKKLAQNFGLAGKVTATYAEQGSDLYKQLEAIAESLGEFPHKKLMPIEVAKRSRKVTLKFKSTQEPTYVVKVSEESVQEHGVPQDPWGNEMEEA